MKNKILKKFFTIITRQDLQKSLIYTPQKDKTKEKYFTNFFNENIKNITKSWIGNNSLVPIKQKTYDIPSLSR